MWWLGILLFIIGIFIFASSMKISTKPCSQCPGKSASNVNAKEQPNW